MDFFVKLLVNQFYLHINRLQSQKNKYMEKLAKKLDSPPILFSTDDGQGLVQKQAKGVRGILSPHHMYVDMCTSYASTPFTYLLTNVKEQARVLMGDSNAGSCSMNSSGEVGALKKVRLNKGRVATILPLKELEKLWHVVFDSRHHGGAFVLNTDAGNIVLKNNDKGMPYLDLRELKAIVALSLVQTV